MHQDCLNIFGLPQGQNEMITAWYQAAVWISNPFITAFITEEAELFVCLFIANVH